MQQLSKQELVDFYCTNIPAGSKHRRQLVVHVCSQLQPTDKAESSKQRKTCGSEDHIVVVDINRTKEALPVASRQTAQLAVVVDRTGQQSVR
jgi:hypothetical protein